MEFSVFPLFQINAVDSSLFFYDPNFLFPVAAGSIRKCNYLFSFTCVLPLSVAKI